LSEAERGNLGGLECRLTPSGHRAAIGSAAARRFAVPKGSCGGGPEIDAERRPVRRRPSTGSRRRKTPSARGLAATPHGLRRRRRNEAVLLRVRGRPVRRFKCRADGESTVLL
ncbi:unnamed protein product, partial [Ixodes pacificus]